jgi:hypothetical protein
VNLNTWIRSEMQNWQGSCTVLRQEVKNMRYLKILGLAFILISSVPALVSAKPVPDRDDYYHDRDRDDRRYWRHREREERRWRRLHRRDRDDWRWRHDAF